MSAPVTNIHFSSMTSALRSEHSLTGLFDYEGNLVTNVPTYERGRNPRRNIKETFMRFVFIPFSYFFNEGGRSFIANRPHDLKEHFKFSM